jgi:hypothetical protein
VRQLGKWRLDQYEFRSGADEVQMSCDHSGSGRVVLTVVFELDKAQMGQLMSAARPAD